LADTISAVDAQRKLVTTAGGDQLAYDALMLVVAGEPGAAARAGPTWDNRAEAEIIGGLPWTFRELDPALTVRTLSMRSSGGSRPGPSASRPARRWCSRRHRRGRGRAAPVNSTHFQD
jgi:hypothetical protein